MRHYDVMSLGCGISTSLCRRLLAEHSVARQETTVQQALCCHCIRLHRSSQSDAYTWHLRTKRFVTMLTYMHRIIESCVFSLIDMPLFAMQASQYMSIYVALHCFVHDLVTWYLRLCTWYLGSTTQCVTNHSLFARLIHNFDWRVYQFFLPARLALV